MKKAKICSAVVALLALGLVACNGQNESKAPSSTPKTTTSEPASQPASEPTSVPASTPASEPASVPASQPDSQPAGEDYLTVIPHTWTEGTKATNSSGKEYIPLTDEAAGKVGVKICIADFTLDAEGTTATGMSDDGKINPGNDHGAYIRYRVVAPKAGAYQMIMRGKSSSNALERTLAGRAFNVRLNGVDVDVVGDRTPLTDSHSDFVAAPTIMLTGEEDTIDVTASDYRIQFDKAGFVVFAEH